MALLALKTLVCSGFPGPKEKSVVKREKPNERRQEAQFMGVGGGLRKLCECFGKGGVRGRWLPDTRHLMCTLKRMETSKCLFLLAVSTTSRVYAVDNLRLYSAGEVVTSQF
ncbi:hypothetical protein BgiBS90_000508 [Biomphalaria glabrata]|nr:hypothetical protein BgiMline_010299 [Biomphalaria glabrata]KAI8798205.1 hypothetical protein BgiBS90_000508 [Biomphalaria glabrata]